jgi:2,3-bisphosphoglycerate-independent phosphoglycerate mutase
MAEEPMRPKRRVLFVFVDGFGIGPSGEQNPISLEGFPGITRVTGGVSPTDIEQGRMVSCDESSLLSVDATFGVPGLPQSGSGQTALFTGLPAPRVLNRHVNGFPNRELREMLYRSNILKTVRDRGRESTFLNAFRDLDPERMPHGRRLSCTTHATIASGAPFRDLVDLAAGRAVYHDITGETLSQRGYAVTVETPEHAAVSAHTVAQENSLTMFECFMTDRAGHSQDTTESLRVLRVLDRFLRHLTDLLLGDENTLVVLSSDHGNIENTSNRSHTLSPVPVALWGSGRSERERLLDGVSDISGVAGIIERWLFSNEDRDRDLDG